MNAAIAAAKNKITPVLHKAKKSTQRQIQEFLAKADDDPVERADKIVSKIDLGDLADIETITPEMQEIFKDAAAGILGQVEIEYGGEIVNQVDARAVAYASEHAADLVSQIDDSTREELRRLIAQGLADNKTAAQIADELEETYSFSEDRSTLIAETEIGNAHGQGSLEGMRQARDAGVHLLKEWYPDPDPCPECEENADAGPIELDDDFPSGDDAPYAHPNCRCVLITVQIEDDENDSDN